MTVFTYLQVKDDGFNSMVFADRERFFKTLLRVAVSVQRSPYHYGHLNLSELYKAIYEEADVLTNVPG